MSSGGRWRSLLPICVLLTLLAAGISPVLAQIASSAESLQREYEDLAKPIAMGGLILGVGLIWFGNDESTARKIGTEVGKRVCSGPLHTGTHLRSRGFDGTLRCMK